MGDLTQGRHIWGDTPGCGGGQSRRQCRVALSSSFNISEFCLHQFPLLGHWRISNDSLMSSIQAQLAMVSNRDLTKPGCWDPYILEIQPQSLSQTNFIQMCPLILHPFFLPRLAAPSHVQLYLQWQVTLPQKTQMFPCLLARRSSCSAQPCCDSVSLCSPFPGLPRTWGNALYPNGTLVLFSSISHDHSNVASWHWLAGNEL